MYMFYIAKLYIKYYIFIYSEKNYLLQPSAFREAVAKTLKKFFKKGYSLEDCRQGIIGAIRVHVMEPDFEGAAKTKLSSDQVFSPRMPGSRVIDTKKAWHRNLF